MPLIQPLNNVPEHILQRYLSGEKSRELYEATYISSLRPDPRDMDNIVLVSVTVRDWARNAMELIDRLIANPQHTTVGRTEHELSVLCLVSVAPVSGNSGGGIDEESLLMMSGGAASLMSTN